MVRVTALELPVLVITFVNFTTLTPALRNLLTITEARLPKRAFADGQERVFGLAIENFKVSPVTFLRLFFSWPNLVSPTLVISV
jgi:hypothetical protein